VATLLIVAGVLTCLVAAAFAAFAWNGRRLAGADIRDLKVLGDAGRSPLSGDRSAWWRVRAGGAERCSSDKLTLTDGAEMVELAARDVDPHPEEVRRFACAVDPLADPAGAQARELHDGEVADTPYTAEEYSLAPGMRVALGPGLFAAGRAADIRANARRGSAHMTRLAAWVGTAGIVLVAAGIFLR
jgi:hypothetical protein